MSRQRILEEIRRMALLNGGRAPGRQRFEQDSGIKESEWYPHLWLRWSDAVQEAGLAPNQLQTRLNDSVMLGKYVDLVKSLGHVPVSGELRRKAQQDPTFPSHNTFHRFGGKAGLLAAAATFVAQHPEYSDLLPHFQSKSQAQLTGGKVTSAKVVLGVVYLLKSGKHYKIGRTNHIGRREWELGIKIPIRPKTIHVIETDDPAGVEAYWHRRFADKRGEGEWFELTASDIEAFKRWRRIA